MILAPVLPLNEDLSVVDSPQNAWVVDLSMHGLSFVMSADKIHTNYVIQLSSENLEAVQIIGKVVRHREIYIDRQYFQVGFEFMIRLGTRL